MLGLTLVTVTVIMTMIVIVRVIVAVPALHRAGVRLPVRIRHQTSTKSSATAVVEPARTLVVSSSRSTAAR